MQTEKKSFHCVFACTCMTDYSILHERVCYLLYKKIELWDYVAHQILYECTKFGTNIVGEMCTNSVT